jgi:hypothetical protein
VKHSNYLKMGVFILFVFMMISNSFAEGQNFNTLLPDIPEVFTEIDPAVEYPNFKYKGLKPGCANCPPTQSEDGELISYDPKFSFFVRGGNSNNLVIYFQGGGACWDSMNCLYAHTYYEEVPPIEMFANTKGMGIFDTDNPRNPFKEWSFVYIPYCTGDIHWGANDQTYEDYLDLIPGVDSWTIQHRGFVNFQVVLKWIKDNFTGPDKIFVTGSSAGGYGAILGFPYIKEAFPLSRVYVLGDGANGVVGEDFKEKSISNWNIQLPKWIFKKGYTPDLTIADIYTKIAARYPLSKLAQYTTAWDWNQTFFYNVMRNLEDPIKWGDYSSVWCDWHDQMLGYTHETAEKAPNYRYYIAAGTVHTILMTSPEFYNEKSAGVTFVDWVNAMVGNLGGTHGHGGIPWENLECAKCGDPLTCQ